MMIRAFEYRLYPSKTQQRTLEATLETCRHWYNACLAERKTAYDERKETIRLNEQLRGVKVLKATSPYAAPIHSHILQVVAADLDKTFVAFFRRVKAGEKAGYPRFKGRNRFSSFGLKEYGNGFKLDGRRLKMWGIGRIRVRWHRPLEGRIKTLWIVRKVDAWYACFTSEVEARPLPATGQAVGVDVGLTSLLTTSDGEHTPNPRWYRAEQRKLRTLQRRVARRSRGGKNRRKAITQLQRQHQRITNRRKDYLNKIAHNLIVRYDQIALEDLRIHKMVKNRRLAKSILDTGWGYLMMRLRAKAEEAGRVVLLVDPAYTSKTCSGCGAAFEHLTLAVRWVECACGLSLDRDHNAAINIAKRSGQLRWDISSSGDGLPQEALRQ